MMLIEKIAICDVSSWKNKLLISETYRIGKKNCKPVAMLMTVIEGCVVSFSSYNDMVVESV